MGDLGSATRDWADHFIEQIIRPALGGSGYESKRADDFRPGWISPQILDGIAQADLIVAVLTGLNPNVFWEMGIADAYCKPVVLLALEGTPLPFDVRDRNILFYREPDAEGRFGDEQVLALTAELAVHAEAVETKIRLSPFARVVRDFGNRYALLAVYDGKAWVQSVFNAAIEEVCNAFESDYELKDGLNPEALRGLARLAEAPAHIYHEQCRALHQSVQAAHLHDGQRRDCLAACTAMREVCNETLLLADRLRRKSLEAGDIAKTRQKLHEIRAQGEACRLLIERQQNNNDPYQ